MENEEDLCALHGRRNAVSIFATVPNATVTMCLSRRSRNIVGPVSILMKPMLGP